MKQKLLNERDEAPQCALCIHGTIVDGDDEVLCPRYGVMKPDGACRKYRYDPLKRKPQKAKLNTDFDPSDFAL
ncbi:MAG: hypothetical protein IKN72_04980 [Clostridia bacterium]|nr:hypothetical protein [Clostridia bacterium]